MKYWLYSSSGNTVGVHEYIGYFEIGDEGYCCRYLEVKSDGTALRYTEDHKVDKFGQLPEGKWDDYGVELGKSEYGMIHSISHLIFDAVWLKTACDNH